MSWRSEEVEARRRRIVELSAKGIDSEAIAERRGITPKMVNNILFKERSKVSA